MRLNLKSVEERVRPLGGRESYDREFIFDLMAAYGRSKGNITRLRNGSLNVADDPETEVAQKNVVYFKPTSGDLYATIDELRTSPTVVRFATRFVIVTDYVDLLAVDTKTNETLAIPIAEIDEHFTFFLPWAGMEKAQYVAEAHADVKAAERMAKLFDELLAINPDLNATETSRHALNVFFTRLLFCYFAEDTGVFKDGQFTSAVEAYTQLDGSDVDQFLNDLFLALDTEDKAQKPSYLADFGYVNGRLFAADQRHTVPKFNKKSRDALIELGKLRWEEINPDIFGSMFQAVVAPGQRSDLGQHYTSVPNILKTIDPLFMDELKEQFNKHFNSIPKLKELRRRISEIKIFDPACGSGNFLVIAYKELRKLEHAILERIGELSGSGTQQELLGSWINIENFYGIEIDPFATEVAILSMWIAKHQMNVEFREKFGIELSLIPLKEAGQVHQGNATRVDWNSICANNGTDEIYLISNPPYLGSKRQTAEQKADFPHVFGSRTYSKNLDYIALWFVKGADYISGTKAQLSFVTTNSVSQGEHVGLMFPMIFEMGLEVGYAYTSFKWENNAKGGAGVTVAVINLRNIVPSPKYLYTDDMRIEVKNINGYLADGNDISVSKRTRPLAGLPKMEFGNMPLDGGNLIMSPDEREALISEHPSATAYTRRLTGSTELIKGVERWCLWIGDSEVEGALEFASIKERVAQVEEFRLSSKDAGTRKKAGRPYSFREQKEPRNIAILVPNHSSERREYIPIDVVGRGVVATNALNVVYDPELWLFGLLTSKIHMAWMRAVGGKLKKDYRYSNSIVYNNFPVPPLSDPTKERLTEAAYRVLDVREYHSEKTLAELYDPEKMPGDLREAHQELDDLVDRIYKKSGFELDEDRLSYLFRLYEEMTAKEEAK
ncbi:class I SAM-dependent DNA methyltransferase [Nesterenkonia sp. MY13]|uniref:site-specific DNA-methyltransferase (adenine-specific) n=1 Tax=Nesterenkonia sedimenti TaxID=1463632 RepID=A0A7X8TH63_9MICC|nr:class I SAM-dependent DNA methyltransferase [Nesterenkonia sedimenti]NLS08643.1 class I SAM-dependent DNA methyltransferase [Nesterenkonia sedimenti]